MSRTLKSTGYKGNHCSTPKRGRGEVKVIYLNMVCPASLKTAIKMDEFEAERLCEPVTFERFFKDASTDYVILRVEGTYSTLVDAINFINYRYNVEHFVITKGMETREDAEDSFNLNVVNGEWSQG